MHRHSIERSRPCCFAADSDLSCLKDDAFRTFTAATIQWVVQEGGCHDRAADVLTRCTAPAKAAHANTSSLESYSLHGHSLHHHAKQTRQQQAAQTTRGGAGGSPATRRPGQPCGMLQSHGRAAAGNAAPCFDAKPQCAQVQGRSGHYRRRRASRSDSISVRISPAQMKRLLRSTNKSVFGKHP